MTHKLSNSRHTLDSCTYQLHSWKPFQLQTFTRTLTLDSDTTTTAATSPRPPTPPNTLLHNKRPCFFDRNFSIDTLDLSKLTLLEDDRRSPSKKERFRWVARKRRRRGGGGSRSVSGRSSDRSRRAAYATCSDFPAVVGTGTDSSGELFVNGDVGNWSSDVSEAKRERRERKERRESGGGGGGSGSGEKESLVGGFGSWGIGGGVESQGNESGYGSEPGYRGDAEFGYGDEFDEEEDDGRVLFWGERLGDTDCNMELVGEKSFSEQKTHHRCRRKKQLDCRMVGMSM